MDFCTPGQRTSVEISRRLICRWTGFELKPSTPQRLYTLLEGRCAALDFTSVDDYLYVLGNLCSTDEEPQRLINLITNGLTAFWRDDVQLEMLRSIMADTSSSLQRPLQIWCAGCSTGEEPFTVAMLANELGIDAKILGTDVNTDFLSHASQGIYGPWSLRRLSLERRQRFFTQHDSQSWKIHPELRSIVTFQHHNLLNPLSYTSETFVARGWDIILCRNVLIYLSTDAIEKVYHHFANALATDGYLLLSSSEQIKSEYSNYESPPFDVSSPTSKPCFQSMRSGDSFVYRRCSPNNQQAPSTFHDSTYYNAPFDAKTSIYSPPPPIFSTDLHGLQEVTSEIEETHAVAKLLLNAAQYLQDSEYEAAITTFEAAISYDPFIPEAYCLIGKTLYENGAYQLASEAFRKALFLEPHNWYAAHQMAELMMTLDVHDAARQAWRQTLEGLNAEQDPLNDTYILLRFIPPLAEYRESVRQRANAYLHHETLC